MGLEADGTYRSLDIVSNSGGRAIAGYAAPEAAGEQTVVISWKDNLTGELYREDMRIYADVYEREGETTVVKGDDGGGCSASSWTLLLPLLALFGVLNKRPGRDGRRALGLFCLLVSVSLFAPPGLTSPAHAAEYVVTDSGDDLLSPPAGSLRGVLQAIEGLGDDGSVVRFTPEIERIELKDRLTIQYGCHLDGLFGRTYGAGEARRPLPCLRGIPAHRRHTARGGLPLRGQRDRIPGLRQGGSPE